MNWSEQSDFRNNMKCTISGTDNSHGSAKILFTCHPDDFSDYFQEIINDISSVRECPIWYYEPDGEKHRESLQQNILFMNLVVVPVTERLLNDWRSLDSTGIPWALKHHISILPIVVEKKVVTEQLEKYEKVFGKLQYIDKTADDYTAIDYKDKLRNHLEFQLFDEKTVQRIRSAFDAMIFISYRKKDRSNVNDLIRLIHKNPDFRDIAVWYDEFLTIGEDFTESIKKAIDESVLCTLAVTDSILEPGNFILENEYGMMCSAGKKILPIQVDRTDKERLSSLYGIRNPVSTEDTDRLYALLRTSLENAGFTRTTNDPVHDYLLGLAYLKGIHTETDDNCSYSLLKSAAEHGVTEAIPQLVNILRFGHDLDYRLSENEQLRYEWQEKYTEALRAGAEADRQGETGHKYIRALFTLAEIYTERKYRIHLKDTEWSTAVSILQQIQAYTSGLSCIWFREEYAKAGIRLAEITEGKEKTGYLLDAVRVYEELYRDDPTASHLEAVSSACNAAGLSYETRSEERGRHIKKAAEYAAELRNRYPSENADMFYLRVEFGYGEYLRENGRMPEARERLWIARDMIESKMAINENRKILREAYPVYAAISKTYDDMPTLQTAISYMEKAVDILLKLGEKNDSAYYDDLWRHYEMIEEYYSKLGDYESEKKYYLLKQDRIIRDRDMPHKISEHCRFARVAIEHRDYKTAIMCRDDELDRRFRESSAIESMDGMIAGKMISERYIAEAETWPEEDTGELWRLKDRRNTFRRQIEWWEECDRRDMPYHRPD